MFRCPMHRNALRRSRPTRAALPRVPPPRIHFQATASRRAKLPAPLRSTADGGVEAPSAIRWGSHRFSTIATSRSVCHSPRSRFVAMTGDAMRQSIAILLWLLLFPPVFAQPPDPLPARPITRDDVLLLVVGIDFDDTHQRELDRWSDDYKDWQEWADKYLNRRQWVMHPFPLIHSGGFTLSVHGRRAPSGKARFPPLWLEARLPQQASPSVERDSLAGRLQFVRELEGRLRGRAHSRGDCGFEKSRNAAPQDRAVRAHSYRRPLDHGAGPIEFRSLWSRRRAHHD